VNVLSEAETMARDHKIGIFKNDIIYRLIQDYQEWCSKEKERRELEKLEKVVRPCRFRILPGFVFRKRKPAVFGVEILAGVLKSNTPIQKEDGKDVGKVKKIEKEGKTMDSAKTGDKVALSMNEPTVGRQINEGEVLISVITRTNVKRLKEIWNRLQDDEKQLLREWELTN